MLDHGVIGWRCSGDRPPPGDVSPDGAGSLPQAFLEQPVLIIEDEAMIAWTLDSLLEDLGFVSITITARGEDAIAAATQLQPGLIVSDINLGIRGMDGIAATIAIRRTRLIPILFVTGHAGADATARIGHDLPDALVLRKPIAYSDLQRALVRLSQALKPS
ncbi:hypothetical protein AWL63_23175 (plasmid) [Sphingomonas panacis]|uniref:Response regulatory domain-containing protein n=1 Tax=Sphingomonas panacis TaxID=1560345 RepID=A0A1B3ZI34_9SPHN|nr:response regulator [Sphingomonas panacis]AOH87088.1 hypothetical protein AWL63_23175 [Sphingomonas panacis]